VNSFAVICNEEIDEINDKTVLSTKPAVEELFCRKQSRHALKICNLLDMTPKALPV